MSARLGELPTLSLVVGGVYRASRHLGFDGARCLLPSFEWSHIEGFGDRDLERLSAFIHNNAALILRPAREATSVCI